MTAPRTRIHYPEGAMSSPKFKLDLRMQEAAAVKRLLDAHMHAVPSAEDRERLARIYTRLTSGIAWMQERLVERGT